MTTSTTPMRVVLTRDVFESEHLIDVVVSSIDGVTSLWGREDAPIIPRSAIKSIQVIPLLRTGAADAFAVTDTEVALGAASHSAEPDHVAAVAAWLARIGRSEADLECGPDRPIHEESADAMLAAGGSDHPRYNCCTGKHTGFLTIAAHLGLDHHGYIDRGHPVQQLITEAVEEFTGVDLAGVSNGRDGCGIPTFSFPAERLSHAMARLVTPELHEDVTAAATTRIVATLTANPWWVSGTGRPEVTLTEAASEPLIIKGGAEGVVMGALPDRGLGFVVKSRDGSRRGADAAAACLLEQLDVVAHGHSRTVVTNKAGTAVGEQYVELT
ncbi:MAG: asparaginase [Acidimicrobiales bacterium]|nr:asparaginase [Acidimicrobiales bacterium]RZV48837.1 MAG: asparaginase [Acidimicrobiales bacterium]